MEFSEILNNLIVEHSTTQKELAKSCGLSPQCVSALVTGRNKPTGITLIALSKYFGCSADYLLGLVDDFGTPTAAQIHATTGGESSKLSEKEKALLKAFKKLLPETQDFILRTAQSLSDPSGEKSLNKT